MEWQDEGIILGVHPYGERTVRLHIFTKNHGPYFGLWRRSVTNRVQRLQIGMGVTVQWRARLESHMGFWRVEPKIFPQFSFILSQKILLSALVTVCALCRFSLPERQNCAVLYEKCWDFFHQLNTPFWPGFYAWLEYAFLQELGYGLDLSRCAVTGETTSLTHVSPVSGRAVCAAVARPYISKLLPFPLFFQKTFPHSFDASLLKAAFYVTGFFLHKHILQKKTLGFWYARKELLEHLEKTVFFSSDHLLHSSA